MAIYYVDNAGDDGAPGSIGDPFLTIQHAVETVSAGDTINCNDGTYTDTDANGIVAYLNPTTVVNGTIGSPITLQSTNPFGATLTVPGSIDGVNAGIYNNREYWFVKNFTITGGTGSGASASNHGVYLSSGALGARVEGNHIHTIGRTVCSNSAFGFTGIYTEADDIVLLGNRIHGIGRLMDGEGGCSTDKSQHDHGIYISGGADPHIIQNIIYDAWRGWPIQVFGGTVTDLLILQNLFGGKQPDGTPAGHILLASTITGARIQNNLSYDANTGMVQFFNLTATNVAVSFNLSDTAEKTGTHAGVTFSNNLENAAPDFVNAGTNDYHLLSTSDAIDAGTDLTSDGITVDFDGVDRPQGAAYDIGPYEFEVESGGSGVVGIDAIAALISGSSTEPSSTALTIADNPNRLLVALISIETADVTSLSWNGVALSQKREYRSTTANPHAYIWYLINPDVGNHTFAGVLTGPTNFNIRLFSLYNVDQANPFGTEQVSQNTTNQTTATPAVTSAIGGLVLDLLTAEGGITGITAGVNQTNASSATTPIAHGSSAKAGDSSVTMVQTWTNNFNDWTHIVVPVNAAAASATKAPRTRHQFLMRRG